MWNTLVEREVNEQVRKAINGVYGNTRNIKRIKALGISEEFIRGLREGRGICRLLSYNINGWNYEKNNKENEENIHSIKEDGTKS